MVERKKLGELLLEAKVINATQLQSAIAHQRQWGSRLGTALMEKGFVDEETLAKFLSQQRGMPSVVLSKMKIPPEVLKRIPRELQEKHVLVPIAVEKTGNRETLTIAMADPSNLQALDEIKFAIGGVRIKTVIAVEATIKKAITGDSRQFRPSLGPPPAESNKPEITDEFAVVRGTMEQTVITQGSTAVVPGAPAGKSPASATRTPARGVDSAPIGEAVLELDVDPEISEMEPVSLDSSDFEPIVTNVGPAPVAPPSPVAPPAAAARAAAAPASAGTDPFLDALRGPPRQPNGGAPAAVRPAPVAAAVAAPARAPIPGVSPFIAPDEDHTERDIPMAKPAVVPPPQPAPAAPFSMSEAFPVEAAEAAPVPAWSSSAQADPWPEPPAEPSFDPLAEAAPWPPVEESSGTSPEYAETIAGPVPDASDLGPGAVPVLASGVSPLENSVPEISLPGPEMPEGAPAWNSPDRVGAFDPDTAPETDIGAAAGSGLFSIPSELEVQEASIPDSDAPAPPPAPALDQAWEPTAADEPMPEYVEPGFETAVSATVVATAQASEIPAEAVPSAENNFQMGVETMIDPSPSEGDLAPFSADPTVPEYEPTSSDGPPMDAAPEPEPAMTSSTAGMVPSMAAAGQDHAEATAIGSGHHEPTWDAPMEFTAPPEGSVLGEQPSEIPAAPVADQLAPREIEEDRQSVTRESPFPLGSEVARLATMLSPTHVDEPPLEAPPELAQPEPEPEAEPEHEPTVFSSPETEPTAFGAPDELAPPPESLIATKEVTPPTRQSDVVPPMVEREPTPIIAPPASTTAPNIDISGTGAMAAATSDEQAALNTLVSKKLKLLNAITEILLEKGLITEDEIREKISKKK